MEAWSPYCHQKPNFKHEANCQGYNACPWCGQANPAGPEVITIPDSPPARQSQPVLNSSRFGDISKESISHRQNSITRHKKTTMERPDAGIVSHSNRLKGTQAGVKRKFVSGEKVYSIKVVIYSGEVAIEGLGIYDEWVRLCMYSK